MNWAPGYREWAPSPALKPALACLWVRVVPPEGPSTALVLPDGCVDLIWQQGRGAFVAGPDTGPVPTPLAAGAVLVGVRFRPGAGGPAFRISLNELLNQRVDFSDLRPDLARGLSAIITPSMALRRIVATAAQLITNAPPDTLVLQAGRLLSQHRASVEALARQLGISGRQFRRRFHDAVGYGPKTLQRVLRFQRFLAHIDGGRVQPDLASVAFDVGYADQPHLTREVTDFSGLSPAALVGMRARFRSS